MVGRRSAHASPRFRGAGKNTTLPLKTKKTPRSHMPRFAANLGHLFTERPLIERFSAAAAAGFTPVELQFPYDTAPSAGTAELKTHNLTQLAVNTPQTPEAGLAALPGRERDFDTGFKRAL